MDASPPALTAVFDGAAPVLTAPADEQVPSTPTPRRSQTTEFTTLVTLAAGAEGTMDATSVTIAMGLEVTEATGSPDTMEFTAERTGSSMPAPAVCVAEAVGQAPRIPMPKRSQTTELTTLVTVAAGADGTAEATSVTIALALEVMEAAGRPETIELTADNTGSRMPAPAVGPAVTVGQAPRIPIPRRSQTTELTTLVTVAAGAEGTAEATWVTMPLALEVIEATGRSETIELTAETIGPRRPPAPAAAVVEGRRDVAPMTVPEEHFPSRTAMPRRSQTTLLTTETTV